MDQTELRTLYIQSVFNNTQLPETLNEHTMGNFYELLLCSFLLVLVGMISIVCIVGGESRVQANRDVPPTFDSAFYRLHERLCPKHHDQLEEEVQISIRLRKAPEGATLN